MQQEGEGRSDENWNRWNKFDKGREEKWKKKSPKYDESSL